MTHITHFRSMFYFKTSGFLTFLSNIEMEHWPETRWKISRDCSLAKKNSAKHWKILKYWNTMDIRYLEPPRDRWKSSRYRKKSKILFFYRLKNWVKLILYLVRWETRVSSLKAIEENKYSALLIFIFFQIKLKY